MTLNLILTANFCLRSSKVGIGKYAGSMSRISRLTLIKSDTKLVVLTQFYGVKEETPAWTTTTMM